VAISVGDAVLKVGVDTKDIEKGMSGLKGTLQRHSKAIGIGMTAMGGAIVAGFGLALKAATGFESAMREVNTMMGLSQEEFSAFSDEVQVLASDLGVDAVEAAKALYQAISAGIPKENALEFLKIATKAAIGGITSTEIAVDGLTTVINAFKLPLSDTQRVADLMFQTVKGGKTTFEELSASLFQVAPIAAAAGVGFDEVSAALATMTKQGIPTRIATTQLRQAMVALQRPTEDMNKIIQDLGYQSGQAMLEEKGLAETLNILKGATAGSNEMLMKMFGSVEAGQAVLALTGENAIMLANDLASMENATGAATGAFTEMEKSAARQMATLKETFKGIQITIGNVLLPVLSSLLGKVKPIIDSIKNWIKENPKLTKVIVLVVGALGSLLLVLGPLILLLPTITAALPILGAAFAILTGPIGLVIAIITGLIAVGVLLWKNWDKVRRFAEKVWYSIKLTLLGAVDSMLGALEKFVGWLPIVGDRIRDVRESVKRMIDSQTIDWEASRIEDRVEEMTDAIKGETEEEKQARLDAIKEVKEARLDALAAERSAAKAAFDDAIELIDEEYGKYEEVIKTKEQLLQDASEVEKQVRDTEMEQVRQSHDERIEMLESEYDHRIKTINATADSQIQALQDEINAIDKATEKENLIKRRQEDKAELRRLISVRRTSENEREVANAKRSIAKLMAKMERDDVLQRRNLEKEALRDRIAAIRDSVQEQKDILKTTLDENRKQANDLSLITLDRLASEKESLDFALQEELERLEKEGEEKRLLEESKLLATVGRLEAENRAILAAYAWRQREAAAQAGIQITPDVGILGSGTRGISKFAHGGVINEPTLLYGMKSMKPYAMAGERGREYVSPGQNQAIQIFLDGEMIEGFIVDRIADKVKLQGAYV